MGEFGLGFRPRGRLKWGADSVGRRRRRRPRNGSARLVLALVLGGVGLIQGAGRRRGCLDVHLG